jgi:hydrogenase maturation protein HypF
MKSTPRQQRLQLKIQGAVQGIGFRPFIYRLATELGLNGWVNNSSQGVWLEVEGDRKILDLFLSRLQKEKPPRSQIQSLESQWLTLAGYTQFEIRTSVAGEKTAVVLPDLATCPECLSEIFDPRNRRYRYAFTNCTHCGPRYSIIEALPYDRSNTTMKGFEMCAACQAEYENPRDRRFHAQPNACPQCGPHLALWDVQGRELATHDEALSATAAAIRAGKIVALKGLGGFQLMVDASNTGAIQRLRQRKRRPEKPFALMYPSLAFVKADCQFKGTGNREQGTASVTPMEEALLISPEAPIVLLKAANTTLSEAIAPRNPYLAVMLPYTPLHHLLMAELGCPVVATSGNLSDEPICIDEGEALQRLAAIADLFLIHNRPIARPVDDSIVRVLGGRAMVLRRARGYAPFPLSPFKDRFLANQQEKSSPRPPSLDSNKPPLEILAVGGHLKNTIAIAHHAQVFISQHIGDLSTAEALASFHNVMASLASLYDFTPTAIACDAHPDYLSTQFALSQGLPVVRVQHHYAHVLACMADNGIAAPVLGVAWDGTGYGTDGTIWGGEFLCVTEESYRRVAHFRTFRLPGGERALKEPRRVALGLLYEYSHDLDAFQDSLLQMFSPQDLAILKTSLSRRLNAPVTSSVGRLFDGVASVLGIRQQASFEGQAAMELEFAIAGTQTEECYPFALLTSELEVGNGDSFFIEAANSQRSSAAIVDWSPILAGTLDDLASLVPLGQIAAKFHNTLVEIIVTVAKQVGEQQVVLTGGCFQNRYLSERAIQRLQAENFRPFWHQRIPANDGGISLGQVIAAARSSLAPSP